MAEIAETKRLGPIRENEAAIYDYASIRSALAPVPINRAPDEDCPGCGWSPNECRCMPQ
jgi:hypothetical protein